MSNRKLSKLVLARERIPKSRYRHYLNTAHKTTWRWLCKHMWQPETCTDSQPLPSTVENHLSFVHIITGSSLVNQCGLWSFMSHVDCFLKSVKFLQFPLKSVQMQNGHWGTESGHKEWPHFCASGIWVLPGHVLCPQDLVGGQSILGSDQSYPRQNYNMVSGDWCSSKGVYREISDQETVCLERKNIRRTVEGNS